MLDIYRTGQLDVVIYEVITGQQREFDLFKVHPLDRLLRSGWEEKTFQI
jgi:hypothetical protein